jgi:hypothetical protein
MKVQDPKRRRRLVDQVARGDLTLIKLRDKIEGRRARQPQLAAELDGAEAVVILEAVVIEGEPANGSAVEPEPEVEAPPALRRPLSDDSLVNAKASLAEALDELVAVLREPDAIGSIGDVDRDNLAKYLTISKLRLENAIALVRSGELD